MLDVSMCEATAAIGGIVEQSGDAKSAIPILLESLAQSCELVAARRPEHAALLAGHAAALADGRLSTELLVAVGERSRVVDRGLHATWCSVVRSLATCYDEVDPSRAAPCRAALARATCEAP
jgi:hypothetical protein